MITKLGGALTQNPDKHEIMYAIRIKKKLKFYSGSGDSERSSAPD